MARGARGEALEVDTLALRGEPRPPRPFVPSSYPRRSSGKDCDSSLRTHTGARLSREIVSLSPRDGVKVRVFYQPPSSWSQPDESFTATARTTSNTECLLARTQLYSVGPRPLPLFSPCGSRVFPARGSLPSVLGTGGSLARFTTSARSVEVGSSSRDGLSFPPKEASTRCLSSLCRDDLAVGGWTVE